jgi:hypothetical protein
MAPKKSSFITNLDPQSILKGALNKAKQDNIKRAGKTYDIISFTTDLLNRSLRPAQEIVLKFFYAGSRFNENLRLSEKEIETIKGWTYPQPWLFDTESSKYKQYLKFIENFGKDPSENFFRDLVLLLGRRSGKSWLTALISAYEAYKLISIPDPVAHYGIDGDIWIVNMSTTAENAKDIIFKQIKKFIDICPVFEGRIHKSLEDRICLYTDADIALMERNKEAGKKIEHEGSVVIASGHSNSRALRGHACSIVVYDEMAFFVSDSKNTDEGGAGDAYNAMSRSLSGFFRFGEGRNVVISTPDLPSGFFFNHFINSQKEDRSIVFQIPTWDADPIGHPMSILKPEFDKDFEKANAEYGAQFRFQASSSYFPRTLVEDAMKRRPNWFKHDRGPLSFQYYMHIDTAKTTDRWAIMVAHPEWRHNPECNEKLMWVVEDYSITFSAPNKGYLNPDKIIDECVFPLLKNFNVVSISSDQFFSLEQKNKLNARGHRYRELQYNGPGKNKIYETARDYFINCRIELCNDDFDLQGELCNIMIDREHNPPKILKNEKDKDFPNDDTVDALCGCIYSMCQGSIALTKMPSVVTARTGVR